MAAIPTLVTLQTGNGQNLLTWNFVPGATGYTVQRCTDGVTFVTVASPTLNFYTDSAAIVGTAYFYQVSASTAPTTYVASYPASITPCLPGQINLGYLRYNAQLRADKLNSPYLTTDEWNWNINQSATELYDILVTHYGEDYFFAPPLNIAMTGAASYPVPDGALYSAAPALYKLNGIDANVSGAAGGPNAGWIPLGRSNWSDRDRYTTFPGQAGALNNVYQMSYRTMGNQIYFFPANQNMLVRIWYVPMLAQMLLDTDMLPFSISGWSEFVIVDAAIKAMDKEESFEKSAALMQKKMGLIERIETSAMNRDAGQPNAVSNIRATTGDVGFSDWGNGFGGGGFGGSGMGY